MIRHMSWKRERLIEGDEIIIKVVDLEKKDCSTPASYDLVDTEAIRYSMDWLLKTLTENGYTL